MKGYFQYFCGHSQQRTMKGFKKIILMGIVFGIFLLTTDAKKKETKSKEVGSKNFEDNFTSGNEKFEKKSKYETSEKQNIKKSTENIEEESKYKTKKYKLKKDTKYTIEKDRKNIHDEPSLKTAKKYHKTKKYKLVEEEPAQKITNNAKSSKAKQKVAEEETFDEIYKSVKKTSQKKLSQEDNTERVFEEGLNNNEENIIYKDESPVNSQKKRKYKLVELVLEEDADEDLEGNETIIELGSEDEEIANIQRTEREEVIEKFKSSQTLKMPKSKKTTKIFVEEEPNEEHLEESFSEDSSAEAEHPAVKYENSEPLPVCKPLPEDPDRQGPKKLTLYVIEEEIDGRLKKRVVSEEDGVTMCEVADLLKNHYYAGLF